MRNLLRAALLSGAFFLVLPVCAADPELPDKDALRKIASQLDSITKLLQQAQVAASVQEQKNTAEMKELRRRIDALEQQLQRVDTATTRVSASFTPSEPPPAPATGSLRLRNLLSTPTTFYINGTPFVIEPGDIRQVPRAALGGLTWEAWSDGQRIQAPTTTELRAREMLTLYVQPTVLLP